MIKLHNQLSKKEIVEELKLLSKKLGRTPKKRDDINLAMRCHRHFGSFNKAKIIAGLSIVNVIVTKFPKKVFKKDKDLAAIISYLTFDGHLYKNLKGLMYSSKRVEDLKEFDKIMKRKFGIKSYLKLNQSGSRKQTHIIYFFNKIICKFLFKAGCPKGDKVIQAFDVPSWIKKSREFSREYLKIAYLCEGSFEKEEGRTPRITINTAKCVDIIDSGIEFMDTLRKMLKKFNISSLECHLIGRRIRKRDNKITRDIRFRINIQDNDRFIREIRWLK